MRALILAAGRGTRISRYLSGNPKCTVDIGNKKLIQYTVNLLKSRDITEIGIVLGYRQDVIKNVLRNEKVKFFYNPFFDVTNSIASAWFAKDFFAQEDTLIMNGDVFMEETLLDEIIQTQQSPVLFADVTRREEADYKFFHQNGVLLKYGKDLRLEETSSEYIGVAKMDADFVPRFVTRLEKMICEQQHSVWWENVLYSMTEQQPIYVADVCGKFWAEVDYIEDYDRIKKFVDSHEMI